MRPVDGGASRRLDELGRGAVRPLTDHLMISGSREDRGQQQADITPSPPARRPRRSSRVMLPWESRPLCRPLVRGRGGTGAGSAAGTPRRRRGGVLCGASAGAVAAYVGRPDRRGAARTRARRPEASAREARSGWGSVLTSFASPLVCLLDRTDAAGRVAASVKNVSRDTRSGPSPVQPLLRAARPGPPKGPRMDLLRKARPRSWRSLTADYKAAGVLGNPQMSVKAVARRDRSAMPEQTATFRRGAGVASPGKRA